MPRALVLVLLLGACGGNAAVSPTATTDAPRVTAAPITTAPHAETTLPPLPPTLDGGHGEKSADFSP